MNFDAIQKILATPEGQQFRKFLLTELSKLRDISKLKDIDDPTALAIEVKAQKKAYEVLNAIVIPMLDSATASPTMESSSSEMLPD